MSDVDLVRTYMRCMGIPEREIRDALLFAELAGETEREGVLNAGLSFLQLTATELIVGRRLPMRQGINWERYESLLPRQKPRPHLL